MQCLGDLYFPLAGRIETLRGTATAASLQAFDVSHRFLHELCLDEMWTASLPQTNMEPHKSAYIGFVSPLERASMGYISLSEYVYIYIYF